MTSPQSGVGTHYLVDVDGGIYQLVADSEASWHAGYSILQGIEDCNGFTLGIEIVNKGDGRTPYALVQQAALLWLLKRKVAEYGIKAGWIETHKNVRGAWKFKYPEMAGVGVKVDPAGLDVAGLLRQLIVDS